MSTEEDVLIEKVLTDKKTKRKRAHDEEIDDLPSFISFLQEVGGVYARSRSYCLAFYERFLLFSPPDYLNALVRVFLLFLLTLMCKYYLLNNIIIY